MLNRIILAKINQQADAEIKAMQADALEKASGYRGWVYPVRYLLALRYLKTKQTVLDEFRRHKIYPISDSDFKQALVDRLSKQKPNHASNSFQQDDAQQGTQKTAIKKSPWFAVPFKSWLLYPVIIGALAFSLVSLNDWYQQRRIENVLANYLPYYTDLLHQKLLLRHAGSPSALAKLDTKLEKAQKKVLADLPEKGAIRSLMKTQLEQLGDSTVSSRDILMASKAVNIEMDKQGLPYYISPKSFTLPCSSFIDAPVEELMMLKQLEKMMSDNKPELCRTSMMTVYKVHERKQLYYSGDRLADNQPADPKDKVELPLFLSTRIDKVPAVDSALGLTYKETGIGSLILLDRIKRFTTESVLPALTFQGRNYVIPYWMQGYYEIEESVTKSYKRDLKKIYTDKKELREVKKAVKKLLKNKNRLSNSKMQQTLQRNNNDGGKSVFGNGLDAISVLLGKNKEQASNKKIENVTIPSLDKLDDVLLPSIEYHEAYHQIVKTNWKAPAWQKELFKELDEDAVGHSMEELGAYLSQLANTDSGHNIWLSKLLIFSLNPMTQGQAEYYASGIILTSMQSLYKGEQIKPRFEASVEEKTEIFKKLSAMQSDEIRLLAKATYEILFERAEPELKTY